MSLDFAANSNKGFRLLAIYERLLKGEDVNKKELSDEFNVTPKSVQRDIDDLRSYLVETHFMDAEATIQYDRTKNCYRLVKIEREWLTPDQVLAISKVILESRAFNKDELEDVISKLLSQALPETSQMIKSFLQSELYTYTPPHHGKAIVQNIWKLTDYIKSQQQITFTYKKQDLSVSKRTVNPVAIIFSEYYFYLSAFDTKDNNSILKNFRADRIENIEVTGEKFNIPYSKHFKEGEYKNRIQFMYPGKLFTVRFKFSGDSLEAVLDRLPTAKVIEENNDYALVEAEIYGEGVKRWLLSQKSGVEVVSPQWFREEMKVEIEEMLRKYKD
ncbi:MAG: WYL domain-containing transcriptional regulator [Oscillospiraceae bacterium]